MLGAYSVKELLQLFRKSKKFTVKGGVNLTGEFYGPAARKDEDKKFTVKGVMLS